MTDRNDQKGVEELKNRRPHWVLSQEPGKRCILSEGKIRVDQSTEIYGKCTTEGIKIEMGLNEGT